MYMLHKKELFHKLSHVVIIYLLLIFLSKLSLMQVYKPTLTRFSSAGGLIGNSPAEVCKGNWILTMTLVTKHSQ